MIRWAKNNAVDCFRACFDFYDDRHVFYFDVIKSRTDGTWKLRWPASWEPGIELSATDAEGAKSEATAIVKRVVLGAAKCFEETE